MFFKKKDKNESVVNSLVSLAAVPAMAILRFDDLLKERAENGKWDIPQEGQSRREYILGGNIMLRRFHNTGAATGILKDKQDIVAKASVGMTGAVMLALIIEGIRKDRDELKMLMLSILLGGALSNTKDRLEKGYVVDYFSFCKGPELFRRLVFNVSDFAIIIGSLGVLLQFLFSTNAGNR